MKIIYYSAITVDSKKKLSYVFDRSSLKVRGDFLPDDDGLEPSPIAAILSLILYLVYIKRILLTLRPFTICFSEISHDMARDWGQRSKIEDFQVQLLSPYRLYCIGSSCACLC